MEGQEVQGDPLDQAKEGLGQQWQRQPNEPHDRKKILDSKSIHFLLPLSVSSAFVVETIRGGYDDDIQIGLKLII